MESVFDCHQAFHGYVICAPVYDRPQEAKVKCPLNDRFSSIVHRCQLGLGALDWMILNFDVPQLCSVSLVNSDKVQLNLAMRGLKMDGRHFPQSY
jgi:hypothetical protein